MIDGKGEVIALRANWRRIDDGRILPSRGDQPPASIQAVPIARIVALSSAKAIQKLAAEVLPEPTGGDVADAICPNL
jgi:hypothetical protein